MSTSRASAVLGVFGLLLAACGGTTTTGTTGSGGSTNAGGTSGIGHGGATADSGGRSPVMDAGSVSPGKVSIEFTVTGPESYCALVCPGLPISIKDSLGHPLLLEQACNTDCQTCVPTGCFSCPAIGVAVTGAKMDWDGKYYTSSTCGSGASCVRPSYAKIGSFTATFCATPGTLIGPDGGIQQCVHTGPEKCASVEFDFPSDMPVKAALGP